MWSTAALAVLIAWRGIGTAPMPEIFGRSLSSWRLLVLGVGLVVAATLVTGTVVIVLKDRDLKAADLGPSYVGAVAAIAGIAIVILSILLWILHGARIDPPPIRSTNTWSRSRRSGACPERPSMTDADCPASGGVAGRAANLSDLVVVIDDPL